MEAQVNLFLALGYLIIRSSDFQSTIILKVI